LVASGVPPQQFLCPGKLEATAALWAP
jgi:hypothetical protein